MANVLQLNTAQYPTLSQVLVNTREGLFDFKAQQSGGGVNVAAKSVTVKAKLKNLKPSGAGQPWLVEV